MVYSREEVLPACSANAADRYLGLTEPHPNQNLSTNRNQPRPYFREPQTHLEVVFTEVRLNSELKFT
jgi:hypothetical protein